MTPSLVDIEIRRMRAADAGALSAMLIRQPSEATRFFSPFPPNEASVRAVLDSAVHDRYWGVFIAEELVGVLMLRGWDEGYAIPAYGVLISVEHTGIGLGALTLSWCIAWCRLNHVPTLMLKVHKDNARARGLYERRGFIQVGSSESGRDWVYHLLLERGR